MAKGGYQKQRLAQKKAQQKMARKRARRKRTLMTWGGSILSLALIALLASLVFGGDEPSTVASDDGSETKWPTPCTTPGPETVGKKTFEDPPCQIIDPAKSYTATMKTSQGTIELELFAKDAPITVNNFVFLAQQKFYDGSLFHRIIPDFGGPGSDMIQGGDAVNRNGTGDPGYSFTDENLIPFDQPGYIAMANSGPGTNGSQFFLLSGTVQHLNVPNGCSPPASGCHSVFGRVVTGLDVISKIADVERGPDDKPTKDVVVESVTIEEA